MPLTIQVFIPSGETEATLTAITGTGTPANPYAITQQGTSQFGTIEVADVANLLGLWQWKVGTRAVGRVLIVAGQTDYPILSNQQAAAAAITQAGLLTGNLANGSLAKTVRDSKSADVLFEGQIVTAAAQSATLNGDATTVCVGQAITIGEEGDIERQTRWVTAFDPDTKIVTLDMPWCVVPGDGADYQIKVLRRSINETQTQTAAAAAITAAALETEQDAAERQTAVLAAIDGIEVGGDATEAKQDEILAAVQGAQVIQVPSPNVLGNLVLTQGDTYDGVGNPKAQWNVTTDYTDGWSVNLTIRDKDDAVVYTNAGTVDSATVVRVAIATPTVSPMIGCPGSWEGKFDVELSKGAAPNRSVKTIALGKVFINEDQTR
jgi:hypothetical protein